MLITSEGASPVHELANKFHLLIHLFVEEMERHVRDQALPYRYQLGINVTYMTFEI